MPLQQISEQTLKEHLPKNIDKRYLQFNFGEANVNIHYHGGINTISFNGVPVTSARAYSEILKHFTQIDDQRGGNPYHGIYMPRPQNTIAQPGDKDIHGVFAVMPWKLENVNESEGYITMYLPADIWKGEMIRYYSEAAKNTNEYSAQRLSLQRLINANRIRFQNDPEKVDFMNTLEQLIGQEDQESQLSDLITYMVNIAYPGKPDIYRKVRIHFPYDEATPVIEDTVTINNISDDESVIEAGGFHSYWNAELSEIVIGSESTGVAKLEPGYDNSLNDVQVRIINQIDRLGRLVILIPTEELQTQDSNQIIYHDIDYYNRKEVEVAIENTRQPGYTYPDKGRIILPGKSSNVGFKTIIIPKDTPLDTLKRIDTYINEVQAKLNAPLIDLNEIFVGEG